MVRSSTLSRSSLLCRLNGQDVAIKSADCFNSQDEVQRLQHEGEVYGMLRHLQGTCLPHLEGFGLTVRMGVAGVRVRVHVYLGGPSTCAEGGLLNRQRVARAA